MFRPVSVSPRPLQRAYCAEATSDANEALPNPGGWADLHGVNKPENDDPSIVEPIR
jgi:hypothetical protein